MDLTYLLDIIPSSDKLVGYTNYPATKIVALVILINLFYTFKFASIRKSLNLKNGPYAWPILGNLYQTLYEPKDELFIRWTNKYGKVFPFFLGLEPRIGISDCEVIKQLCTKDFDNFVNHKPFERVSNKYSKNFIFYSTDADWKRLRAMLSPVFTTSKIRRMYKLIDVCGDDMVECIKEQIEEKESFQENRPTINSNSMQSKKVIFQLRPTFQLYTFDSIASCCYSMRINRQKGVHTMNAAAKSNKFFEMILDVHDVSPASLIQMFCLPDFMQPYIHKDKSLESMKYIDNVLIPMVEKRRKKMNKPNGGYNDLLQVLVETKLGDKLDFAETDKHEDHHANVSQEWLASDQDRNIQDSINSQEFKLNKSLIDTNEGLVNSKIVLTEDEMISHAVIFLAVGVETTSTTLQSTVYALAMHQDCQERLYKEIKKIAKRRENGPFEFDYEELTACAYLDSVISEAIRIHSPFNGMDRVASEDYKLEKYNVNIPKGTSIIFFFQVVHRNPEYWPDPLKFDPERFMPENRHKIIPGSYTAFGQGPRFCMGMRFSLTEAKLALAKLLMNFKFSPKPGNVWPMKMGPGLFGSIEYLNCDILVERRLDDL